MSCKADCLLRVLISRHKPHVTVSLMLFTLAFTEFLQLWSVDSPDES